jgi:Flp pilus assembly pilin Flp
MPLTSKVDAGRRRGVTALEYVVSASLILVVVILAVQHLASATRGLFSGAASATSAQGASGS